MWSRHRGAPFNFIRDIAGPQGEYRGGAIRIVLCTWFETVP